MSEVTKASRPGPRPLTGDDSAKKTAAVILEVLCGLRSTTEAAQALEISSMRYYVLERRALEGMVSALQPRPKGKQRRPENVVAELRREKKGDKRRSRRPQVRAEKTIALLRAPAPEAAPAS